MVALQYRRGGERDHRGEKREPVLDIPDACQALAYSIVCRRIQRSVSPTGTANFGEVDRALYGGRFARVVDVVVERVSSLGVITKALIKIHPAPEAEPAVDCGQG